MGAVYKPRGDVYQTIISRYPALTDYVYDFTAYIKTVTRWFVGREFLFDALESFIRQSSRGYFRLIADAGLGKTALAAEIAKRYTAPAYFFSASEGRTRHDQCLNHFCAQLIARYELPYDHLPERAGQDASFLKRLLREAAERHRSDKPLLLVIDALDEADPVHAGQTWLRLPTRLPEGVCVLLTHRPGDYPLTTDARTPVERFSLAWNDPNQQRDIVVHLQRQAERPEIARALESADPPVPVNEFVAALKSASEGNFMYLAYVLADIECAEPGYHPLSLDELPQGLRGYYEQFWARMKQPVDKEGWSVWNDLRRPVIALLGAAQEPVTVEWLAVHSGREAVEVRERVLHRWQRFLRCERHNGPETWHIVHHTFAEFLAQKLDLITVHAQISDRYLSAWGGLNEVLACLHDEEWRNLDGGYGLRHLVVHLAAASRTAEVHQLLRLEWHEDTRILNTWHAVKTTSGHIGSYLSDIETAWQLAVQDNVIGLQCRYALILASLHSHAGNLPSELLVILTQRRIWTPGQALAHARQMPDLHYRADALAKLAPHLPQQEQVAVLHEALAAARDIGSVSDRVSALGKLVAHLPRMDREAVLREALTMAQEIPFAAEQAGALVGLARYLPEALLREVLTAGQAIEDENSQATVIAGVAPHLAASGYAEEASAVVQGIRPLDVRVGALTKLIPHLAPDKQEEVVQEALTTARGIAADEERAKALADLIPFLSGAAREQVVKEAFVVARAFESTRGRALSLTAPLAAVAPYLPQALMTEAVKIARECSHLLQRSQSAVALRLAELGHPEEALAMVGSVSWVWTLPSLLGSLASHLPERLLSDVLRVAQDIKPGDARAEALARLIPHLPEEHQETALQAAQQAACEIYDADSQAMALARLAPHLPAEEQLAMVREVLPAAREIRGLGRRTATLRELALHLPKEEQDEVLQEALAAAREIQNVKDRRMALAELALALLELGQVEKALATAREIETTWARTVVMTALAPHLFEDQRDQLLQRVVTEGREIENPIDRVVALARVTTLLSKGEWDALLGEALEEAAKIDDGFERASALARLGRYLPHELLREALSMTREIEGDLNREAAMKGLAPRLAQLGYVTEALKAARRIRAPTDRAETLTALASHLQEPDQANVLSKALVAAQEIWDPEIRAEALSGLASHLSEELLYEALAVARQIEWGRAEAFAGLAPHLAKLESSSLYSLWRKTLPVLAQGTREDLLADLRALAPVISALGGEGAVGEVFCAIQDVGRWWP